METEPTASKAGSKLPFLRKLYDWTLSWAEHPAGPWVLFGLAFAESSFFPIPPDVLLIALCVGAVRKSFRFAVLCTVGSVLGGMAGYALGYWGREVLVDPIVRFYHGEQVMALVKNWYDRWGFWGNLAAAVTPIPYKVFTLTSGLFRFSFTSFLLASVIGRSVRFFLVAGLIYVYGAKVKVLIEKYFDLFALLFFVLLIGGVLAIKFLN